MYASNTLMLLSCIVGISLCTVLSTAYSLSEVYPQQLQKSEHSLLPLGKQKE